MNRKSLSTFTIVICAAACIFMAFYVIKDIALPLLNEKISEKPENYVYTIEDVDGEILELINKNVERYAYEQLEEQSKEVYKNLLYGMLSFAEEIDLEQYKMSVDDLKICFTSIRNDYPELFWIDSYYNVYYSGNLVTDFMPQYTTDREDAAKMSKNIAKIRDNLIAGTDGATDYEKALYIFNYLVDYTNYDILSYEKYLSSEYDEGISLSSGIYGTLVTGKALCEGYSKSFQYLVQAAGLDCIYVTGTADGEGHAWNYVRLEKSYYAVDVTWCDPKGDEEIKTYAYFLTDYDTIKESHTDEMPYNLPACTGGKYNYYRYNGYEMTVFSKDTLEDMIYKAYLEGREIAEIHCTNDGAYVGLLNIIQTDELFECFENVFHETGRETGEISYGRVDKVRCVRIVMP